jgi:hypothetical protein
MGDTRIRKVLCLNLGRETDLNDWNILLVFFRPSLQIPELYFAFVMTASFQINLNHDSSIILSFDYI